MLIAKRKRIAEILDAVLVIAAVHRHGAGIGMTWNRQRQRERRP
jgi:hypothetical protein